MSNDAHAALLTTCARGRCGVLQLLHVDVNGKKPLTRNVVRCAYLTDFLFRIVRCCRQPHLLWLQAKILLWCYVMYTTWPCLISGKVEAALRYIPVLHI